MEFVQPLRTKADVERMKEELRARSARDYTLFVLGVNSGLRISDLLRLTIGDVLEDRARFQVRRRLAMRERKTGKAKDFPLNGAARAVLREYLHGRDRSDRRIPLFLSRQAGGDGLPRAISRVQAYIILRSAARSAGILDPVGTHTLRKTWGYRLYLSGVDITRIQKIMNHSTPQTTLSYIGITRDEIDELYRANQI